MLTKSDLRRQMRSRRSALSEADARTAAVALAGEVQRLLKHESPMIIGGYAPSFGEIDIFPILDSLQKRGHRIALPRIGDSGVAISFHEWRSGEALSPQFYGILAPAERGSTIEPDLLLVPLLAFDSKGYRLGYGKGYYDRYLQTRLDQSSKPQTIGCAYDWQRVDALVREPHDIALDAVVTDKRCYRFA